MITTYLECLGLALGLMGCAFLVSLLTRTNTVVDIFWGLGFIAITWYSLIANGLYLPRHFLVTVLVTLWGLRLSGYILYRNWGKGEDPRYTALAKQWGPWVYLQSFLRIFMLQGILLWLISFSIIAIMTNSTAGSFSFRDFVAVLLWCIGFACEVIGDWQLQRFLRDPLHKDHIMDRGIWRLTRHPNYFGELVMWWSMWLLALPVGYAALTIISPLTITAIILFFSLPITEKQLATNPEYEAYKKRTNALLPWTPKRLL